MHVVVVAYGPDLPLALKEAHEVSNILQRCGHSVYLLTDGETSLDCLGDALDHGPFDLAWFIVHSSSEGFQLVDQVLTPEQLGVWLDATGCSGVVLNSCFSAEHVQGIQKAAAVDVVATIDPNGVKDTTARMTGVLVARALAETGDLREACIRASGKGSIQYRWFPVGDAMSNERGVRDDIREQLQLLVMAVQGDPRTGTVGLLARVERIGDQLEGVDRRLETLESRPATYMGRGMAMMIAAVFVLLLALGLALVHVSWGIW